MPSMRKWLYGSASKSSFEKDPMTILLVKDHAPVSFIVKTKVSTLVSFEVDHLKKKPLA